MNRGCIDFFNQHIGEFDLNPPKFTVVKQIVMNRLEGQFSRFQTIQTPVDPERGQPSVSGSGRPVRYPWM